MKLRSTLTAASLGIGGLMLAFSLLFFAEGMLRESTPEERTTSFDASSGFLLLGLPGVVLGGGLLYQERQQTSKQESDRLLSVFYQLVQTNQGTMSVMDFALAAELSGDRAKTYLDAKAREFDATFQTTDSGALYYCFPTAAASPALSADTTPTDTMPTDSI
ncbi:MAG: hypothetical protein KME20_08440 [Kaiparowitsia implicata GSE-PSE-MK54-09C]|jgi:hypothetical protein|nr:hypothetical protein [Kaiparowitsia implicata GSE-PSE-MK54-09C]